MGPKSWCKQTPLNLVISPFKLNPVFWLYSICLIPKRFVISSFKSFPAYNRETAVYRYGDSGLQRFGLLTAIFCSNSLSKSSAVSLELTLLPSASRIVVTILKPFPETLVLILTLAIS